MSSNGTEWTRAEREEVFAEALHGPETEAERVAQCEKFRAWLADERYRHLWPMLQRLLDATAVAANGAASARPRVAS